MKNEIFNTNDYKELIYLIKKEIQSSQIKASISVNKEMLKLYWFLSSQIVERQKSNSWGDGLLKHISKDLRQEFPNMKGFSERNIKYMRQWYLYWNLIRQQVVAQLETQAIFQRPWGQNLVIITKSESQEEAIFYVQKTITNNWSRAVLTHQIELGLFTRQGQAINNFVVQLPKVQSDLALQTIKDPYCFDFLTLREKHDEKELETALIENITHFLLELGAGFSFVGRQYKLSIDDDDFYIDLLFYHIKLHACVVVELKTGKFKPEFAGKLNFYISAVDDILVSDDDNPTIGVLICKSKKRTVVEYSLKDVNKPMGISEYELTKLLPDQFKSSLPSIEEIEAELGGNDE